MANDPQVPWTDEQWARVNQVIQEEAKRARVAATFLPLYGPLSADADYVWCRDFVSEPGTSRGGSPQLNAANPALALAAGQPFSGAALEHRTGLAIRTPAVDHR